MKMKKLQSLYLVAAEHGYRLLRDHEGEMVEIAGRQASEFPDVVYEFPNDRSRAHAGLRGPNFDTDRQTNKQEQERGRFAQHVVAALVAEWDKGGHDRIIISAGPKMLGELRDAMPKALQPHVAAELHKDLMKIPVRELSSHFTEVPGV